MQNSFFQRLRRPGSNRSPFFYIFSALIFGMIIITFIFMSPNGGSNLSGSPTAATVGGRVIPILVLQQRAQQIEEQNRMFMPEVSEQFRQFFQSQALNDLINAELLTEIESKEELYVADSLLAKTIMDIPEFQEKGQFKRDMYESYLLNSGSSANSLEERIKKDLRIGIVRELFNEAFLTTNVEKEILGQISDFDIKMEFVDVSESALNLASEKIQVSDDEIKQALVDAEFTKKAKAEYDKTAFKYKAKDKVKAKWIITLATDMSPESFDKAKAKMEKIDLNAKNFSEMAKLHSEDPTASQGGDLGYVEKGTFDEAWDKVAFSAKVGEVSDLFKTEQGWARVLVEEKKLGTQSSFDDVKFMVAKDLLSQEKMKSIVSEIKAVLPKNDGSIDATLAKFGLKWKSATDFKLTAEQIPGFSQNEELFEKVISLKNDGDVYPDIVSDEGKSFLIKRKAFVQALKKEGDVQNISGNRQNYSLGNWFTAQKETVKIKINPTLESNKSLF